MIFGIAMGMFSRKAALILNMRFVLPRDLPIVFPGPFSGKIWIRKHGLSLWFYWSERRDLNSGPPVPQTGALTGLRYAPTDTDIIILSGISRNKFKIARISRLYLTAVPLNSCRS